MTFTPEQCQNIMSPILAQGLPSAGFVHTFLHVLAHGPLKFCGVNIPNLFTEQTLAHIHTLLKSTNQPQNLMGFLLCSTSNLMCLELSLTGQLFEGPLLLQDLVMDSWMKHMWLATCQADIPLMLNIPDFLSANGEIRNWFKCFCNMASNTLNLNHFTDTRCFSTSPEFQICALAWVTDY